MLNKNNLAIVGQFVSMEKSRYTLTSIHVTKTETVATNGHYAVRITVPQVAEPNPADVPDHAPFLLEGKQAITIGKALGKDGMASVAPNNAEGAFSVAVPDGTVYHAPHIPGSFPNVDAIAPTGDPIVTFGVQAEYLAKLAKAFSDFQSDKTGIRKIKVSVYDKGRPLKMEATNDAGQTMTVLLMPVRL